MARKSLRLAALLQREFEAKAKALIEDVLKPKHFEPPPKDVRYNDIADIGTKSFASYFDFFATRRCPGPDAISPTFESKFARMEYLGMNRFALSFMRTRGSGWASTRRSRWTSA